MDAGLPGCKKSILIFPGIPAYPENLTEPGLLQDFAHRVVHTAEAHPFFASLLHNQQHPQACGRNLRKRLAFLLLFPDSKGG